MSLWPLLQMLWKMIETNERMNYELDPEPEVTIFSITQVKSYPTMPVDRCVMGHSFCGVEPTQSLDWIEAFIFTVY